MPTAPHRNKNQIMQKSPATFIRVNHHGCSLLLPLELQPHVLVNWQQPDLIQNIAALRALFHNVFDLADSEREPLQLVVAVAELRHAHGEVQLRVHRCDAPLAALRSQAAHARDAGDFQLWESVRAILGALGRLLHILSRNTKNVLMCIIANNLYIKCGFSYHETISYQQCQPIG